MKINNPYLFWGDSLQKLHRMIINKFSINWMIKFNNYSTINNKKSTF